MKHCNTVINFRNLQVVPNCLEDDTAKMSTFSLQTRVLQFISQVVIPKKSQLEGQVIHKDIWEKIEKTTFGAQPDL